MPSEDNPNHPKYDDPLNQITDLAGVRIITFFPATVAHVGKLIEEEFEVVERSDKGDLLLKQDKFGYQSIHYLAKLKRSRADLAEYKRFSETVLEIQVRTILQHAWAEIEHDIQYKSSYTIPSEIKRRFMSLAGMLEIADREFQAIQVADETLTETASANVQAGKLEEIEITPRALKAYLDKRLGPDGRLSDWSYDWTARLVKRLGFTSLDQIEQAIGKYDDRRVSAIAEGSQVGQLNRFEYVLLAAMGRKFIERHAWAPHSWFITHRTNVLNKLASKGLEVETYDPLDADRPA